MKDKEKLGYRIRYLRKLNNMTQQELANILNISNTTLSQYESGKRVPSDEIKKSIADYFQISLDYLMGRSNIKNPYSYLVAEAEESSNFSNPRDVMIFLLENKSIMEYANFNIENLEEKDLIKFADEMLHQLKLVGYKYNNK